MSRTPKNSIAAVPPIVAKPISLIVHGFALHYGLPPSRVAQLALNLLDRPHPQAIHGARSSTMNKKTKVA